MRTIAEIQRQQCLNYFQAVEVQKLEKSQEALELENLSLKGKLEALGKQLDFALQYGIRTDEESEPKKTQFCYSESGEAFTGQCDSREEAAGFAVDSLRFPQKKVWTGRIVPLTIYLKSLDGIGEDVLRDVCDAISSDMMADEPVFKTTPEQADALTKHIIAWLVQNVTCSRYGVEDVQEHPVPISS